MGTGLGIFWVDFLLKPFCKGYLLKHPELAILVVFLLYSYIGYKCLQSAWQADRY
jgi:hypothetical protein